MNVVKGSKVATLHEAIVVYAENGDPELGKLLDPNDPDYEGWTLDWHRAGKFVLKKETILPREAMTKQDCLPPGRCPICDDERLNIQVRHDGRLRDLWEAHYEQLAALADAHASGEHEEIDGNK